MKSYQTIEYKIEQQIASVYLNRPDIHNAFNETMISELIDIFQYLSETDNEIVRVIVLRGNGKSFCAGADLNWMRNVANYTYEQNFSESYQLSQCFYTIYTCKKPTISIVHGAAIGGANGLLAATDFAYALPETVFSLSEVKIGIIPACISPYVIKRVGEYNAKDLMLSGKRFNAEDAKKYHLINDVFLPDEFDQKINDLIALLKTSGPQAMAHCKNLIHKITNELSINEALEYTAKIIADIRASDEGQEGMAAFLEKRKPSWIN